MLINIYSIFLKQQTTYLVLEYIDIFTFNIFIKNILLPNIQTRISYIDTEINGCTLYIVHCTLYNTKTSFILYNIHNVICITNST